MTPLVLRAGRVGGLVALAMEGGLAARGGLHTPVAKWPLAKGLWAWVSD